MSTTSTLQQSQASVSTVKPSTQETLTLTLVPRRRRKAIKWAEDVVEVNEHSGKKSSKKCCVFHRRRTFGDWSDDDDSDAERPENCLKDSNKSKLTPGDKERIKDTEVSKLKPEDK
mmetsp:Transcript_10871/g.18863  ORF Transcript_10871/g.18863 Transcript_10871/m.18863 type:complete len:116 (-) Transcript_10871:1091-1438(-)